MNIEELENYNRIITYNDDNHDSIVFINGERAGSLEDELSCLAEVMKIAQESEPKIIKTRNIYIFDFSEEESFTEEEVERIDDFFYSVMVLTPKQEIAIINRDYKELLKLI